MWGRVLWAKILEPKIGGIVMERMNVTEKDFEAFEQAAESLIDGTLKQGGQRNERNYGL